MRIRSRNIPSLFRASVLSSCALVGCNALGGAGSLEVLPADVPDASVEADAARDAGVVPADAADATSVVDAEADADSTTPKRVFLTKVATKGDLGGRGGGDALCASAASREALGGAWIAWLSVIGSGAIERIRHRGPYQLLDGTPVVASREQLVSGTILHAINRTEDGLALAANEGVWTGTKGDGTPDETCNDWMSSSSAVHGTLASATATDVGWTKGAPQSGLPDNWKCDSLVRLYCFEL